MSWAGYGKTMLLSAWVSQCAIPVAWISLDEGDNDPARFLLYVVGGLEKVTPGIGQGVSSLLQSPPTPSQDELLSSLLNEIVRAARPFALVLDDYHLIHNSANHELVSNLLHRPPRSFHLLLAARHDPPIPLPALRARGVVTELRASDLRFTLDETEVFFHDILNMDIPDQEIVTLSNKTEGWPVSLDPSGLTRKQFYLHRLEQAEITEKTEVGAV